MFFIILVRKAIELSNKSIFLCFLIYTFRDFVLTAHKYMICFFINVHMRFLQKLTLRILPQSLFIVEVSFTFVTLGNRKE